MTQVETRGRSWWARVGIKRVARWLCAVALSGSVACGRGPEADRSSIGPGSDAPPAVSLAIVPVAGVHDTVDGIERIKFAGDAFSQTAQWTIDSNAITVAGGVDVDPDYDLTGAHQALLFSDGGIVTFASVGAKLLMFSASGKPERTVGRSGKGPGEFTAPHSLVLIRGDSLLVLDAANQRLNWITRQGKFAAMKKLPLREMWGATPVGLMPNGELLVDGVGGMVGESDADSVTRSQSPIQLMTIEGPDLGTPRTIATVPNFQMLRQETRYRGRVEKHTTVLRYTLRAQIAPWGNSIVTGDGASYQFDVRNTDGQLVRQVHVGVPRRPVTKDMRDTMISLELKRLEGPKTERMVDVNESRRLTREAPFSDSVPAFHQAFVSPNGTLWLVDGMALGDTAWSATAFNREGAMIGRVQAPGFAYVMAFGDDRVLLRVEDADGVVSMRVHKLIAAPRP